MLYLFRIYNKGIYTEYKGNTKRMYSQYKKQGLKKVSELSNPMVQLNFLFLNPKAGTRSGHYVLSGVYILFL